MMRCFLLAALSGLALADIRCLTLDKPEFWPAEKRDYCCKTMNIGCCPKELNCPAIHCVFGEEPKKPGQCCPVCKDFPAAKTAKVLSKESGYNCLTLDEPAFWSAGKREHCCRTKNMACYRCESRDRWSDRKTAWCCANEKKGCPSDEGLRCLTFDLPENWTDEKRSYCCRTRNMTCYKCDTREAWSARKTAWCCANEKKGCPN